MALLFLAADAKIQEETDKFRKELLSKKETEVNVLEILNLSRYDVLETEPMYWLECLLKRLYM